MRANPEMLVFLEAVEKDSEQARAEFLQQACGADPALREGVEALLKAHALSDSPLDHTPEGLEAIRSVIQSADEGREDATSNDLSLSCAPGTIIGRYKIMEQIGEGAVGLVFVAAQQRPVQRLV